MTNFSIIVSEQADGEVSSACDALLENCSELLGRISSFSSANVQSTRAAVSFRDLFFVFLEICKLQDELGGDIRSLRQRSELATVANKLLDAAAGLPAETFEECCYKLALWRHDYPRSLDEAWPRGDIVAASAFDDLAHLAGASDAVPEDEAEEV